MKILPKVLVVFVIVGLIIFGIYKYLSKAAEVNINTIPKNANIVLHVDLQTLLLKAKFNKIKDMEVMKFIQEELRNENKELSKQLDSVFSNPLNSGINLLSDLYIFAVYEGGNIVYGGATIGISNKNKFKKNISKISDGDLELEKNDGILLWSKDNFAFGFDDSKLLMFAGSPNMKIKEKFLELMRNTKDKSIKSNSDFNEFNMDKNDLGLWMNFDWFEDFMVMDARQFLSGYQLRKFEKARSQYKRLLVKSNVKFDNSYLHSTLNFSNGKIELAYDTKLNSSLKKFYEEFNYMKKGCDKKLLAKIPGENLFALLSIAVDMKKVFNVLNEFSSEINDFNIDELDKEIQQNIGYSLEDFLASFGGDLIISINGLAKDSRGRPIPKAHAGLTINNEEPFKKIIAMLMAVEGLKIRGNYYKVGQVPVDIYLTLNDGAVIVSTDEEVVALHSDKKKLKTKSLGKPSLSKNVEENSLSLYLNLNVSEILDEAKSQQELLALIPQAMFKKVDVFERLDLNTGVYNGSLVLSFKDKKENSLWQIITTIDKNYKDIPQLLPMIF